MTVGIAMEAARGIVLSCDRSLLAEFGGHVRLNRHWAYSLLTCMRFVKRDDNQQEQALRCRLHTAEERLLE